MPLHIASRPAPLCSSSCSYPLPVTSAGLRRRRVDASSLQKRCIVYLTVFFVSDGRNALARAVKGSSLWAQCTVGETEECRVRRDNETTRVLNLYVHLAYQRLSHRFHQTYPSETAVDHQCSPFGSVQLGRVPGNTPCTTTHVRCSQSPCKNKTIHLISDCSKIPHV